MMMHQEQYKQHETMLHLKSRLVQLNSIINIKNICFLDLPIHHNFGDTLIMLGSLDFFKQNDYKIKSYSTYFNWHAQSLTDNDVIVFSGGGNFGDIHKTHQLHREKIIQQYTNYKIVILPQTIFFNDHINYKKTCAILKQHPDLHICVRDTKSRELALNMTHNVYLIPDMAHQLYPTECNASETNKTNKIMQIKRQDLESDESDVKLPVDLICDWKTILGIHGYPIYLLRQIQKLLNILYLNSYSTNFTTELLIKYSYHVLSIVVKKLNNYETIYSSRLHGFILANLLQKQAFLIDNSYGKNKQYFAAWFR